MLPLLLIAAAVALVWGTFYVLRGSTLAGALAFVVVGAVLGHPFLHFDLGPIPLTLDRIVLAVAVVTYVVQGRLGRTAPKPLARGDVLLFALVGLLIVSGTLGGWTGQLPGNTPPVWRLLSGYLMPLCVYWIARQSRLDAGQLGLVYGTLTILGVYLGVTGLLEVTGQWWAVFPRYIADPTVGIHFGRARGPMVHSVSYGLYLGVCLLAVWAWQARFGRLGRLILYCFVPLMLAGLFFSYTRSVWMGMGLASAVVLGLTLRGAWRPLVLGGMATAALVVMAARMDSLVSLQREGTKSDTRRSVDMRASFTYVSWLMFKDRPLLGVGFGHFPTAKLPYLSDRATDLNLESIRDYVHHNTLLSLLTETGLIGLTLFLGVLACWAHAGWRLARGTAPEWARRQGVLLLGVLALYACQLVFHELTYTPLDNSLIFLMAGLTVGLQRQPASP